MSDIKPIIKQVAEYKLDVNDIRNAIAYFLELKPGDYESCKVDFEVKSDRLIGAWVKTIKPLDSI